MRTLDKRRSGADHAMAAWEKARARFEERPRSRKAEKRYLYRAYKLRRAELDLLRARLPAWRSS